MEPRVFRGTGAGFALRRLAPLTVAYVGGWAALMVLGLAMRGPRAWVIVSLPLALTWASSLWRWRRVCAQLEGSVLRYEGSDPRFDFEAALDEIAEAFIDVTLERPTLVLVRRAPAEELTLDELSPRAAEAVLAALSDAGVLTH